LAATSSSTYLLVLSGIFSVVKRSMLKYVLGVTALGGLNLPDG
jgi:multisubunit Na+/H+ antiporter MnhC subunit